MLFIYLTVRLLHDCSMNGNHAAISEEYVEPKALAAELGVSWRTLHRWHVERLGPPRVVVGRTVLYRRESVRQWLLSREESQPRSRQRTA
jgi:predicted DNA-binding transcriptional regulator AlpA